MGQFWMQSNSPTLSEEPINPGGQIESNKTNLYVVHDPSGKEGATEGTHQFDGFKVNASGPLLHWQ